MAVAVNAGRASVLPTLPGAGASPGAIGAQVLLGQEEAILREAELYFATADMTSLALAAAVPPKERMDSRRLPAESGLIVFAEPIGGYTEDVGAALADTPARRAGVSAQVTIPIVAASWTTWSPSLLTMDGAPAGQGLRWLARFAEGGRASSPTASAVCG